MKYWFLQTTFCLQFWPLLGQNPCDPNPCGINTKCWVPSGQPFYHCKCLAGFRRGDNPFEGCADKDTPTTRTTTTTTRTTTRSTKNYHFGKDEYDENASIDYDCWEFNSIAFYNGLGCNGYWCWRLNRTDLYKEDPGCGATASSLLKIKPEDIEEGCKNAKVKDNSGKEHDFRACYCKGDLCYSNYEEHFKKAKSNCIGYEENCSHSFEFIQGRVNRIFGYLTHHYPG